MRIFDNDVQACVICKEADRRLDVVNNIINIDKKKKWSKNRALWNASKNCGPVKHDTIVNKK